MTLPGFRHFIVEKSATRVLASLVFLSRSEASKVTIIQISDSTTAVNIEDHGHVSLGEQGSYTRHQGARREIGGFARWGIKVMEMAAEIGRRSDLPLYVHFGTL